MNAKAFKATPASLRPANPPATFFTVDRNAPETVVTLKPTVCGKFLHLKFTERHGKGDNIDVGTIAFVGFEGKDPSAAPAASTPAAATATAGAGAGAAAPAKKGFSMDWASAFAKGAEAAEEVSPADAKMLSSLKVMSRKLDEKVRRKNMRPKFCCCWHPLFLRLLIAIIHLSLVFLFLSLFFFFG